MTTIDRAQTNAELERVNRSGDRAEDAGRTEEAAMWRRRSQELARLLDDDARERMAADDRAELLELADLAVRFLAPAVEQATRRVERMTARASRSHKIDDARQELQEATRALDLARKHSPTRNAILAKFGTDAV